MSDVIHMSLPMDDQVWRVEWWGDARQGVASPLIKNSPYAEWFESLPAT